MRYVLAIAALVLAGVLLLLGIGQLTFLAGPAEIRYELDTKSDAAFVTLSGEELAQVPGQANIVTGGSDAVVATGSTVDVEGWVAPFEHLELTVDPGAQALDYATVDAFVPEAETAETEAGAGDTAAATDASAEVAPEPIAPMSPKGSDLWLQEKSVAGSDNNAESNETDSLRMAVNITDQQSVIIAADGKSPAPADIAVVWVQDRSTPWAGPLLVAGAIFGLVGAVLYILAIDHDRRGLGPRRGRRGPLQGIQNVFSKNPGAEKTAGTTPKGDAQEPSAATTQEPSAATAQEPDSDPAQEQTVDGEQTKYDANPSRSPKLRRFALPAVGLTLALGLSGCSASYWPQFDAAEPAPTATESPNTAPVPITDSQINRILGDIAEVSGEADTALDAEMLKSRFAGDALTQRTANYAIRKSGSEWLIPPRITEDELDYELVQSTESWPRTMLVTVASTKDEPAAEDPAAEDPAAADAAAESAEADAAKKDASPSLALVLTQASPHDNYLVSSVIALRGGISMPQAAPAEEGTALLADDLETFLLPPGEVGAAFASVLQNGEASEQYDLFDLSGDTILETSGKARAERLSAEAAEKGKPMEYSVAAHQADTSVVALSTGVGGALVAVTVIEEQIVDSAGGLIKPVATAQMTALSGLEGQQDRIVQEFAHQMLFFVPSKADASAKIQLLGDTSEMVGARN